MTRLWIEPLVFGAIGEHSNHKAKKKKKKKKKKNQ